MHFQKLIEIIPVLDHISSSITTRTMDLSTDRHAIIVVRRGHVTISRKDQTAVVCTQAYACHPAYGPFVIEVPRTKEAEYVIILYRILPKSSTWPLHGSLRTISEIKIHYMVDELLRTAHEIDHHSDEEQEAAQRFRMRIMLERILYIYLKESRIDKEKRSSSESVEETLSYMNEHYMLKLTLPMLAHRAGMSEGHYAVCFKKHTGITMIQYLHRVRIEKAKQMFLQTDLTAKEIAQKIGFNDYFHFSKIFKKMTGVSPTNFRHRSRDF